ncbi:hypothetical protein LY78DRAFT_239129 [Colletotrichum sublineola]|nr:hypothetical protein LY78DRAFT_239129 [Colletotrichum sublineola]
MTDFASALHGEKRGGARADRNKLGEEAGQRGKHEVTGGHRHNSLPSMTSCPIGGGGEGRDGAPRLGGDVVYAPLILCTCTEVLETVSGIARYQNGTSCWSMSKLWFLCCQQKPIVANQSCRQSSPVDRRRRRLVSAFVPGLCHWFPFAPLEAQEKKKLRSAVDLPTGEEPDSLVVSNGLVDWEYEECVHIWRLSGWPLPHANPPSHPTPPSTLPLQTSSGLTKAPAFGLLLDTFPTDK